MKVPSASVAPHVHCIVNLQGMEMAQSLLVHLLVVDLLPPFPIGLVLVIRRRLVSVGVDARDGPANLLGSNAHGAKAPASKHANLKAAFQSALRDVQVDFLGLRR